MSAPLIAILTDFGTQDPFTGILKGVIARLAPGLPVIDLTNSIPAGDIRRAAFHLWQSVPFFPAGTVFLSVVDPGVGTSRRPMILETSISPSSGKYWFVGPDNGIFTYLLNAKSHAWEITNPEYMLEGASKTFHGRDIFAPAAAHLAQGVPAASFGPPLDSPSQFERPCLEFGQPGILKGEVLFADTFGNLLTSLGRFDRSGPGKIKFVPWLPGGEPAEIPDAAINVQLPDGSRLPLVNTFGEIPQGYCAALVGSSGLIEIVSNQASAANLLKLSGSDPIQLVY